MKRRNSVFIALAALLIVAVVAILASWVLAWKSQNIPTTSTTKRIGHGKTVSPTKGIPNSIQLKEGENVTENFGSPENWIYFNQNYQSSSDRKFRFKYPPVLELRNVDSAEVRLKKNDKLYLTIEETFPLTEFTIGNSQTQDEKFVAYYFDKRRIYRDFPDLEFERINLGENAFLYKVVLDYGDYYLGEINEHGIEIVDYKKLPGDVVHSIIKSIEFK